MKAERNYDFRTRYCNVHPKKFPQPWPAPQKDELVLGKTVSILCDVTGAVAETALEDFRAYLKTAFGITSALGQEIGELVISLVSDGRYMARRVAVTERSIQIFASDQRGIAQALYDLEDAMTRRGAPYVKIGTTNREPLFSPRMTHSGIGLDLFTDEYLSACAHHGYDAVLVFMRDASHASHGKNEYDFNDLVTRAARYGIDVYGYSYIKNFTHPDEPGARQTFDRAYGDVFRAIPGLKGMVFVGESIQFPSKDPRANPLPRSQGTPDGIPDRRPRSGWFPCYDYAQWISLVRDSIRAVKPDADVVLWSYNWGRQDRDARLSLIRTLPTDISLLVTFEMFDLLDLGNSTAMVNDYSIAHIGPGTYFVSEAEAAKERGIPLYSMVNTCGRTWDFGVAPYEPFPWQWNQRHEKILEAREKYGLQGLMESHHNGFLPSFISMQAKEAFTQGGMDFDAYLEAWAKDLGGAQWEKVLEGMRHVDMSIRCYVPSDENQYGPYRIGPAYPFCLKTAIKKPNTADMHFGNVIYNVLNINIDPKQYDPYSIRIHDELRLHKQALGCTKEGLKILKRIQPKSEPLKRLTDLVEFLACCHQTAVNYKTFYILRAKLFSCGDRKALRRIADRIEKVCRQELQNVARTFPLVKRNSDFGYEPTMGYQCDEESLKWKQKHMQYVLQVEIPVYQKD